jgi:triacylglycerol lipase
VPEAVLIERSGLPGAQRRAPDPARPVPLLHGLGGTKSSWSFLARTLRARGLTVDAITYSPFGTSIEQLADRLAAEVEWLLSQTGADTVHLVGHSLGGIVIAAKLNHRQRRVLGWATPAELFGASEPKPMQLAPA